MKTSGLLTCLRYSLPPNNLSYCGPNKTAKLVGYQAENFADQGLKEALKQFDTLYSYLTFIAYENGIRDPFDQRVVEAYWIGNPLLSTISPRSFYRHLDERLKIGGKLANKALFLLYGKLNYGATPHHNFHVFNVFRRTGHLSITHTLSTIDACRISWGKVTKINEDQTIEVLTKPLIHHKSRLYLGKPQKKILINNILGRQLLLKVKPGEWLSFHWQVVCDRLTPNQVKWLKAFTLKAMQLANTAL